MTNENESIEQTRGAPLLLGLRTHPLAITLLDPAGGRQYVAPLTATSAQALALALLAQTGYVPREELLEAVRQEAERRAAADSNFLASCGVTEGGVM